MNTADSLENLAAQADAIPLHGNDTPGQGAPAEEPKPELTNGQVFAGAIAAGREAFCFFTKLESPRRTLDDAAVQHLGEVWGPVFDKHGWDLKKFLGDWTLEITAVAATVGIGMNVHRSVLAELDAQARISGAAPEAPAAETGVNVGL